MHACADIHQSKSIKQKTFILCAFNELQTWVEKVYSNQNTKNSLLQFSIFFLLWYTHVGNIKNTKE